MAILLQDDFSASSRDTTKWNIYDLALANSAITAQNNAGHLEIQTLNTLASRALGGYLSVSNYDMTNGSAVVHLLSGNVGGYGEIDFAVYVDSANYYRLRVYGGLLAVETGSTALGGGNPFNAGYDATNFAWMRIRHSSSDNKIHFETSPSGATGTWTEQYSETCAIDITHVRPALLAGSYGSGSPSTPLVQYDDFVLNGAAADTTPPLISSISSGTPSSSNATITWTTDEPATDRVFYDTVSRPSDTDGSLYANSSAVDTTADLTSHSVALSALTPSTVYYYKVRSADSSGNVSFSAQQTFTTPAPSSTMSEDFSAPTRDASKWVIGTIANPYGAAGQDNAVTTSQSTGQLVINIGAFAGGTGYHFNGYRSVGTFDFTYGRAAVEVVQRAAVVNLTIFALTRDANNYYEMQVNENGQLICIIKNAGSLSYPGTATGVPYDATAHRFWAMRRDMIAGTINFEVSANGTAWTVLQSTPDVLALDSNTIKIELSAGQVNGSASSAIFDNFALTAFQQLPTVNAGADQIFAIGTNLTLSGTARTRVGGSLVSTAWTHISGPNNPSITNGTSPSSTPSATVLGSALQAGEHIFRLTATDDLNGVNSDDVTVTVVADPIAVLSLDTNDIYSGEQIVAKADGSTFYDGIVPMTASARQGLYGAHIDFGDGDDADLIGTVKCYEETQAVTRTVTLTVWNQLGASAQASQQVTIQPIPAATSSNIQTAPAGGVGSTDPIVLAQNRDWLRNAYAAAAAVANPTSPQEIHLQPGVIYRGSFKLTPRLSQNAKWITIRPVPSALALLPPPRKRVTPLDAVNMPIIETDPNFSGVGVYTGDGAEYHTIPVNHYRFLGIQFRKGNESVNCGGHVLLGNNYDQAGEPDDANIVHHIIIDRCFFKSTDRDNPNSLCTGTIYSAARNVVLMNSWIDAQKFQPQENYGYLCQGRGGQHSLINNHIEAAGQCVFFLPSTSPRSSANVVVTNPTRTSATLSDVTNLVVGQRIAFYCQDYQSTAVASYATNPLTHGTTVRSITPTTGTAADVTFDPIEGELTPYSAPPPGGYIPVSPGKALWGRFSDNMEVRRNYLTKDLRWINTRTSPAVMGMTCKNIFESKGSRRVVVTQNILEHSGTELQDGRALVWTASSYGGSAPYSVNEFLDFRSNIIRQCGSGIGVNNLSAGDYNSGVTNRIFLRNNLIYDLSADNYGANSGGSFYYDGGRTNHLLYRHNSLPHGGGFTNNNETPTPNGPRHFFFLDNLMLIPAGQHPLYRAGLGNNYFGKRMLDLDCPEGYSWTKNAFIGYNDNDSSTGVVDPQPAGNYFPANAGAVNFVDYAAKNFALAPSSPLHNAASDGTDVGVDFVALNAATLNTTSGDWTGAAQVLTSIVTLPASASIAIGTNQQFTATALDQTGAAMVPQPSFSWASSNTAKATINSSGLARGVAVGASLITAAATVGGVTVTSQARVLTVTAAVLGKSSPVTTPFRRILKKVFGRR